MTDLPPPKWIRYCPVCMARHNGGHPIGNLFPVQGRCSSCGKDIDSVKEERPVDIGCHRFKFDSLIESQIDEKHKSLLFNSYHDAYNYAVEIWGSAVANNYIIIEKFDTGKWNAVTR